MCKLELEHDLTNIATDSIDSTRLLEKITSSRTRFLGGFGDDGDYFGIGDAAFCLALFSSLAALVVWLCNHHSEGRPTPLLLDGARDVYLKSEGCGKKMGGTV